MRNISIGLRSALAFGIIGFATLLLGIFAILQLSSLHTATDVLALHRLPAVQTATALRGDSLRIRALVSDLSDTESGEEIRAIEEQINSIQQNYAQNAQKMAGLVQSGEGEKLFSTISMLYQQFIGTIDELYTLTEQEADQQALAYRRNTVVPALTLLVKELDALVEYQMQRADESNDEATATYKNSRAALITGVLITLGLLGVLAFLFSRSLTAPLRQAVDIAQLIADGDLTRQFDDLNKDEAADMLRALKEMQRNLRQTLSLITDSSQQLATTSEELSVVTNQSTQVITKQSDQLEQAATAVNEMTVSIEEVARSANSTSANTEIMEDKTKLGQAKINQTIQIIEVLTNEINQSAQGVEKLADNVKTIGSVLDVIRAIADQTNLLALNAAIEAARAGESGRGFAVVADEVRALAHRTQESTKQIESMIQTIQAETNNAVSNMSASSERAGSTLVAAHDAGVAFTELTELVGQINDQNLTIASAAEQQASVAREVDKNLLFIRDLSLQTAAGANQTNASSHELAKLAEQLNSLILKFRL